MSDSQEKYASVQTLVSYGQGYEDNFTSNQEELNHRLAEFLKSVKPSQYRIINAQVVFLPASRNGGLETAPAVQHVLHIAYST